MMPVAKAVKEPTADPPVDKSGWGNLNPWLVVVIGLEVAISIALCVCCMRQRPDSAPITDPMALTALAVRRD